MSDEATTPPNSPTSMTMSAEALAKLMLGPIDYALAAGTRRALETGVPTHKVIELLLNHLSSVAAMVEPAGAREALIRDLVSAFSPMVRQHVEARLTTPGGIRLPNGVAA